MLTSHLVKKKRVNEMIEIPLRKYLELTGMSRQGVHEKIRLGKLTSRKDDKGKVYIILDIDPKDVGVVEGDFNKIESVMGSLLMEYKKDLADFKNELKAYVEKNEAITKVLLEDKNNQIKKLEDKIERLEKRGFFKRLFG